MLSALFARGGIYSKCCCNERQMGLEVMDRAEVKGEEHNKEDGLKNVTTAKCLM